MTPATPNRAAKRRDAKQSRSLVSRYNRLVSAHQALTKQYNHLVGLFGAVISQGEHVVTDHDLQQSAGRQIRTEKVGDGVRVYLAQVEMEVVEVPEPSPDATGANVASAIGITGSGTHRAARGERSE